jgi:hypothetical protein
MDEVAGDDERVYSMRHPVLFAMLQVEKLREANRQRALAYAIYMNANPPDF